MYLSKKCSFILLLLLATVIGSSFNVIEEQSSNDENQIVVYFYKNQGAYTLPMDRIPLQYEKKCVLKNYKKNIVLKKRISQVIENKNNKIEYFECCYYVIEYRKSGQYVVVGFDQHKGIIHYGNNSFEISPSVLRNIKRRCVGKW